MKIRTTCIFSFCLFIAMSSCGPKPVVWAYDWDIEAIDSPELLNSAYFDQMIVDCEIQESIDSITTVNMMKRFKQSSFVSNNRRIIKKAYRDVMNDLVKSMPYQASIDGFAKYGFCCNQNGDFVSVALLELSDNIALDDALEARKSVLKYKASPSEHAPCFSCANLKFRLKEFEF